MGPRLLCFVGGAALSAFYVLLALLAGPFFGSGAFLWANTFACFLLALALGHGLGDVFVSLAGDRLNRVAPALAVAGGITAWLAAYLLPVACRWVLSSDPQWTFAPAVSMAIISLIPGSLLAGILPCELRARLVDVEEPRVGARLALRLMGLMTLGGVFGLILTAKAVLRADEVQVWLHAYAVGGAIALVGMAFLPNALRVGTGVLLVGMAALSAAAPSEAQSHSYGVALQTAWREDSGAGLYYRWTSGASKLSEEDLRELAQPGANKPGIILTLELLERIGQTEIQGDGLRRTVDLLLSPGARPDILPFFEQFKTVRSDGRGMLYFEIKEQPGQEGATFEIPGAEAGDTVEFWFKHDITIKLIHNRPNTWKLEFGPRVREEAGFLEFNDTVITPVRVLNVALWVDASVLAIEVEDRPEQVVVRAIGQGDIGGETTVELYAIPKDRTK
jgi:hypothetical protein